MTYDTNASISERMAAKYQMEADDASAKKAKPPPAPEVLVPCHDIKVQELPKNIQDVVKLLPREPRVMHIRTRLEGVEFKSGARVGQKRPDKVIDHYAIELTGHWPLRAIWSNGKLLYAKGWRNEIVWTEGVNELKKWIKGGWE